MAKESRPILVFVGLETDLELPKRFAGRTPRFHAVSGKVMRGVFHVLLRAPQGFDGFMDLRVPLRGAPLDGISLQREHGR